MDLLFVNGVVLTPGPTPRATAVGVMEGRICATGPEAELRSLVSPRTKIIDLAGQTLIPGFDDSHAHVWKMGHLLTSMLELRGVRSFAEMSELLQARDRALPKGAWLLGRGFNEATLAEQRRPDRHVLDCFAAGRPVVLTRACGHIYAANSAALRLAGINAQSTAPAGGVIERDAAGEPTGLLHETAMGLIQRVLPPPSAAEYEAMIQAGMRHQLSLGITSSSDCGVLPELLEVYLDMDRRGALPARINVMPLGVPDGSSEPYALNLPPQHRSSKLRVDTVKFLADGGLSSSTAALSVPYRGTSSTGVLRFEASALRPLFEAAQAEGWRIATHAIGDVAIEEILGLYEELRRPPSGLRHRMEHLGLPSKEQLRRLAAAGVGVSTQPTFLYELGCNFLAQVPDDLMNRIYPFREMLDAGLVTSFSSDAPVVRDDSPLLAMRTAMLRRSREGEPFCQTQAVTAEEALYACTTAGAILASAEQERGSIRVGLWADFGVLSGDPTQVPAEELAGLTVNQTWLAGEMVYDRSTENRTGRQSFKQGAQR